MKSYLKWGKQFFFLKRSWPGFRTFFFFSKNRNWFNHLLVIKEPSNYNWMIIAHLFWIQRSFTGKENSHFLLQRIILYIIKDALFLVGWLVGFYGMSTHWVILCRIRFHLWTHVLVYLTHRWDPNRCYHSGAECTWE